MEDITLKKPYIVFKDICYKYKKSNFCIENINLEIFTGEITAMIGSNGSGKSTISKIATGILKPTLGSLFVDGEDTSSYRIHNFGLKIGYVFQNPEMQLFTLNVLEEVTFALKYLGVEESKAKERALMLLEKFDLLDKKDSIPLNLSRGEKQRLAICSVLALNPKFLILDEPSTGLDKKRREELYNYLQILSGEGIGILIISHDMNFVNKYPNRVITIKEGKVFKDERKH